MNMPGHITVDKQTHYDKNPGLSEEIAKKISHWASSVPVGKFATLAEVMNFDGYPNVPLETWTDPFENGGVPGVELLTQFGPLPALSFGMPKMVHKLS